MLRLRTEVVGNGTTSTLNATVWKVGSTQPASPQLSDTDSRPRCRAAALWVSRVTCPAVRPVSMPLTIDNYSASDG